MLGVVLETSARVIKAVCDLKTGGPDVLTSQRP